jgi:hypothetical protein
LLLESLESRRLMTVYNPIAAPLITATEGSTSTSITVETFNSTDPIGGLSATVTWPASVSGATAGTIVLIGSNFVPGVGTVPEYAVKTTFTAGATTGTSQLPFSVAVSDSADASNSVSVGNVQILDASPVFNNVHASYTFTEGVANTGIQLAVFHDTGPNAAVTDFVGSVDWGDGSGPSAAAFTAIGGGIFIVSGSHTYEHAQSTNITFSITDTGAAPSGNPTLSAVIPVTVNPAAVTSGSGTTFSAQINQPLNGILLGTFSDDNPFATAADFGSSIDWGDGSATDIAAIALIGQTSTGGTLFGVYGTHTYAAAGTFTVASTITSGVTTVATLSSTANAAPVATASISVSPTPLSLQEGDTVVSGTSFGSFTDNAGLQGGVTYTATALVDGVSIPLTVTQVGTGATFTVASTADAAVTLEEGTGSYTLTITSSTGIVGTADGVLIVTDAPLSEVSVNPVPSATAGAPLSSYPLMIFADANPLATPADYTVSIDWGDGTPASIGTVVNSGTGQFIAYGSHTYAAAGSSSIVITVHDVDGQTLTSSAITMPIADAAITSNTSNSITGQRGQSLNNVLIGTFTDANPLSTASDFNASIDWDDSSPAEDGVIALIGSATGGGNLFGVYGSHLYADTDLYSIDATVTDLSSSTAHVTTSAIITDVLTVSPAPVVVTEGTTIPIGTSFGTFTDPGAIAGVTYTATALVNGTSVPLTATPVGTSGLTFTLTATGNTNISAGLAAGVTTYSLTVTDSDGTSASAAGVLTVNPATLALVSATAPASPVEGHALNNIQVAAFTDPNSLAVASDFVATINWGDGTPSTIGTITLVSGQFRVTGSHTYAEETATGVTEQATVTITDAANRRRLNATTTAFAVADAPLSGATATPVTAVAGQSSGSVLLGTFVDGNPAADNGDFTASINWGDGSAASTGFVYRVGGTSAGALFAVYGNHTYTTGSGSPFAITVSVADVGGSTLAGGIVTTATVADAPIVASGANLGGVSRRTTTGTVATFSDTAIPADLSAFQAIIQWGDGNYGPGTIVSDGNGDYHVVGSHLYTKPQGGTFPINVTITHVGGTNARVSSTASIFPPKLVANETPLTFNAKKNKIFTAKLGSFTDENQLNKVVGNYLGNGSVINWGDGTSTVLTAANLKLTGTDQAHGGYWRVLGTHRFNTVGTKHVKVTVVNKFGQRVTLKMNIVVTA